MDRIAPPRPPASRAPWLRPPLLRRGGPHERPRTTWIGRTCTSWWMLPLLGTVLVAGFVVALRHNPSDDTFIHLRIVRNLVEQGQFAFNLDAPAYTTTSPLWNLVLAGAGILARALTGDTLDYLRLAQVMAVLCTAIALLCMRRLMLDAGPLLAAAATMAMAVDPYYVYAAAGGMEMALFAALALGAIASARATGWRRLLAPLLCALLMQTRPEGWIVAVAVAVDVGLRRGARAAALLLLAVVALSTPWWTYYQLHFGSLLPTSVVMKSVGQHGRLPLPAPATLRQFFRLGVPVHLPLFVALLAGALAAHRGGRLRPAVRSRAAEAMASAGLLLSYIVLLKEDFISSRYLAVVSPLLIAAVVGILAVANATTAPSALETSSSDTPGHPGAPDQPGAPPAAFAGPPAASGLRLASGAMLLLIAPYLLVANVLLLPQRIARGAQLEAPRIEAGNWLAAHTPADAVVCAAEIGYIGFHAQRRLVGGGGLLDPTCIGVARRRGALSEPDYLRALRPDYYVGNTANPPLPEARLVYTTVAQAFGQPRTIWKLTWPAGTTRAPC